MSALACFIQSELPDPIARPDDPDRLELETRRLLKRLEGVCLNDFDASSEIVLLTRSGVPLAACDDAMTLRLIDIGVQDAPSSIAEARRRRAAGQVIVAVLVGDFASGFWLSIAMLPLHYSIGRGAA